MWQQTSLNEKVRSSFLSPGKEKVTLLMKFNATADPKESLRRICARFSQSLRGEPANTSSERLKSATYWWKKKCLIIQTYPQCVRVEVQTNIVVSAGLTLRLLPLSRAPRWMRNAQTRARAQFIIHAEDSRVSYPSFPTSILCGYHLSVCFMWNIYGIYIYIYIYICMCVCVCVYMYIYM